MLNNSLGNILEQETVCLLVVNSDRWSMEKKLDEPFFWLGQPFISSTSKGFIDQTVTVKKNFPLMLLVDTDSFNNEMLYEDLFNIKRVVFTASEWNEAVREIAVFVKDIVLFDEGDAKLLKREWMMT